MGLLLPTAYVFERILDHPVERVWTALTEPGQLSIWLGPTKVESGAGGNITLQMTGTTNGGKILQWGLENLAHAGRDFVRSNFEAGWTSILDKRLASYLGLQLAAAH